MSSVFVALLRGVNVGGRNNVSMSSLTADFENLGLRDVRTYINSGNVLFRKDGGDPAALERQIDAMLAREHGLAPKTVVRSGAEMTHLVSAINRFWTPDARWKCNVIFLRRTLEARKLLAAASLKRDIERAMVCPGTLVWAARIDALSRAGMMKFGRSPAYQDATVRSVATTRAILQLMREMQGGRGAPPTPVSKRFRGPTPDARRPKAQSPKPKAQSRKPKAYTSA